MAAENVTSVDFTGIISSLPGVSTVIKLSQVALVVVIAYFIFLIIRSVVQIRYSRNFAKMTRNVEEINQKMDKLVGKKK